MSNCELFLQYTESSGFVSWMSLHENTNITGLQAMLITSMYPTMVLQHISIGMLILVHIFFKRLNEFWFQWSQYKSHKDKEFQTTDLKKKKTKKKKFHRLYNFRKKHDLLLAFHRFLSTKKWIIKKNNLIEGKFSVLVTFRSLVS